MLRSLNEETGRVKGLIIYEHCRSRSIGRPPAAAECFSHMASTRVRVSALAGRGGGPTDPPGLVWLVRRRLEGPTDPRLVH